MNFLVILQLILYCLVSLSGIVGNVATVWAIRSYSTLSDTLESTTLTIITLLSLCDLYVCLLVIPIRFVNTIVGHGWPFSDGVLCGIFWYAGYPATFVSVWIMLALALTRFCAVFWPFKYQAWLKKRTVRYALFLIPWVIGYIPMTVGGLCQSITTATGKDELELCDVQPRSSQTISQFKWLMITVTFLEVFTPLTLGGLIYAITFIKLYVQRRARLNRVAQATAVLLNYSKTTPSAAQKQIHPGEGINNKRNRLRSVQLMGAAYLAYMVCVYPRQILAGIIHPVPRPPTLYIVVDILFFLSFSISPVIYLLTMTEMREAYKKMLKHFKIWYGSAGNASN